MFRHNLAALARPGNPDPVPTRRVTSSPPHKVIYKVTPGFKGLSITLFMGGGNTGDAPPSRSTIGINLRFNLFKIGDRRLS